MATLTLLIGALLAYANGANDNFKGVATLFGSGTTAYRGALLWATATTALGSVTALFLATELLGAFTGRGLVPDAIVTDPAFALAVGFGAGATVLLATRIGFPISTTHALIGALVGVGLTRSPVGIDVAGLSNGFVLPLVTSPFIAIALAAALYPLVRAVRRRLNVTRETCICIGEEVVATIPGHLRAADALARYASSELTGPRLSVDDRLRCSVRYQGRMIGIQAAKLLDITHYLSAGAVSFARGLNDTPKIAALLVAGSFFSPPFAIALAAAAIALGGIVSARRVAETMAHKITDMTPGQGLTANVITAALVIGASNLGMPVSTTHVSCGSLFGIGISTRHAHWGTIAQIALAWLITLPVAAGLGVVFTYVLPH